MKIRTLGLVGWLISAIFAESALAQTPAAVSVSPGMSGASGQAAPAPRGTPMHAELVRRSDGQWVIARLSPAERLEARGSALSENEALQNVIEKYRKSLSRADLDELETVWIMNPAERKEIRRAASGGTRVSVQIREARFELAEDRAYVTFLQTQSRSAAPTNRRISRRGLAAYDSSQSWDAVRDE